MVLMKCSDASHGNPTTKAKLDFDLNPNGGEDWELQAGKYKKKTLKQKPTALGTHSTCAGR